MIGRLRGSLLELNETVAVIDVGGVGYEVEVTTGAAAALAAAREQVDLYTHFIAREDAQTLYGFADAAERDLFRSVIKISGVGPKLALALLSAVTPQQFATAVDHGDIAAITRVPGIGKKTANRLLVELRDRLDALPAAVADGSQAARDAMQALVSLGYREQLAARMVGEASAALAADAGVEDIVREALQGAAATA